MYGKEIKVTIELPKEFISHFNKDRFKESLERLQADINCVAGLYERELCDMLITAFQNGIVNKEYE